MTPNQRIAVVTGGSRGIGRGIVESLLAADWTVFYCSLDPDSVARSVSLLQQRYPGRVSARPCDIGKQADVDRFISWVEAEAGQIDCLVNNAGIGLFKPVDEISGDEWRNLMRTNLDGAFYAIRAVAPLMRRQGSGWIINIASLAGRNPIPKGAAYNASKFGLVGLSEAAMLDLRSSGVRVGTILPGSVNTEFSLPKTTVGCDWKLTPQDVAHTVMDLLEYPDRALPSIIEIRPTRPPGA